MRKEQTRREVLIGTAATAVAASLSAVALATPAWLVEARAAMRALGETRCLFSTSWCALSLLSARAVDGGADPELYGPDVQRDFAYALDEGWGTLEESGRLMVTKRGRAEWELELLESYG